MARYLSPVSDESMQEGEEDEPDPTQHAAGGGCKMGDPRCTGGCRNVYYTRKLLRRLAAASSAGGDHFVMFGGGLHVSYNDAPGFYEKWQRLFDILPDSPHVFVGWLSNDARTQVTPQVYHSIQSNFKARRFDHVVNTMLNEYFAPRTNPTVWLDPYQLTAKTAPPHNSACTLTANDGTHYGLCVNAMKSKVLMNALCERLGRERCEQGTASVLTIDVECELYEMPAALRSLIY